MMRFGSVWLLLFISNSLFSQTVITGKVLSENILEGEVELYAYKDFITRNLYLLTSAKLDSNHFEIKTKEIGETSQFQLKYKNIKTIFFLEPNVKYTINITKNDFILEKGSDTNLNTKIRIFHSEIRAYQKQNPTSTSGKDYPNFKYKLTNKYNKAAPSFFYNYVKYRLYELEYFYSGIKNSKPYKYNYERFIKNENVLIVNKKARWKNPSYVGFVASHLYAMRLCEFKVKNKCDDETLTPLEKVYNEVLRLKNDELAQLAIVLYLKGLILAKEPLKDNNVLIEVLSRYSESQIVRTVASEYKKYIKE